MLGNLTSLKGFVFHTLRGKRAGSSCNLLKKNRIDQIYNKNSSPRLIKKNQRKIRHAAAETTKLREKSPLLRSKSSDMSLSAIGSLTRNWITDAWIR